MDEFDCEYIIAAWHRFDRCVSAGSDVSKRGTTHERRAPSSASHENRGPAFSYGRYAGIRPDQGALRVLL